MRACVSFGPWIMVSRFLGGRLYAGGDSPSYKTPGCILRSTFDFSTCIPRLKRWAFSQSFSVNPHGRKNIFDSTITEGLSIFYHWRKEFQADRILTAGAEEVQGAFDSQTKVTWFVDRQLDSAQRKRFFPIVPTAGTLHWGGGDLSGRGIDWPGLL